MAAGAEDTTTEREKDRSGTTVLVTGASGFIAMHCILQLLEQGYRVRGTLRTPSRERSLRATLQKHVAVGDRFEVVTADLMRDEGWAEAVGGCRYVLHVASPFPRELPKHEDDLIIPARDGALRVLRAAADAGVERVVLTSSLAAMLYGHAFAAGHVFTEADWSVTDGPHPIAPYQKSKTLAERAAWEFVRGLPADRKLELAVINPGLVLGPVLDEDYGTSGEVVRKLMKREVPGCPDLGWAPVDVRDVAAAHLLAMVTPEAAGERFCCAIEFASMSDIAGVLAERFGSMGYKIPTRHLPSWVMRVVALFDKSVKVALDDLGKRKDVSSEHARRLLGWKPRSLDEMVEAMGASLIEHGVV